MTTTKFIKDVLLSYEESLRATGRTTHLIEKAKKENATFVCHNQSFVNHVMRDYDVKVISIEKYLHEDTHRGKKPEKYIFDHFVEYVLLVKKIDEITNIIENAENPNMSIYGF